jgi:hypothetical protein
MLDAAKLNRARIDNEHLFIAAPVPMPCARDINFTPQSAAASERFLSGTSGCGVRGNAIAGRGFTDRL